MWEMYGDVGAKVDGKKHAHEKGWLVALLASSRLGDADSEGQIGCQRA